MVPSDIPANLAAPTSAIYQQIEARSELSSIGVNSKEARLKRLLGDSVKTNEEQQVLTGVSVLDMKDGHLMYDHNQGTEHFAASINKLSVALLLLQDLRAGKLSLDRMMTWQEGDKRAGAGVFDQPGAPLQATLREVIYDMLNRSGNTAIRISVNGALGGAAAVNARWGLVPELSHTYLVPLEADPTRFFLGYTTPHDSLWTMTELMKTQDTYAAFMKDAMATNIFTDMGVRSQFAGSEYIVLVNKIGLLDDSDGNNRHDVGIIYNTRTHKNYAYSLMTTSPASSATATVRADQSLKDMGKGLLAFAGYKQEKTTEQEQAQPFKARGFEKKMLY